MIPANAVTRVDCGNTPFCPGKLYVPAYVGRIVCPSCGSLLYPPNNGFNGGPMLYDPLTHKEYDPRAREEKVVDTQAPTEQDADEEQPPVVPTIEQQSSEQVIPRPGDE